jgi:uncharacterized membrane protein (DUF485 family)
MNMNAIDRSDELNNLVKKRDNHVHRLFYMMLEFFVIFGVPALIAFFLGDHLDNYFDSGRLWKIVLLAIAFVISWIIVVIRVRKITKELKALDEKIKTLREEK